jgi:hypothetical protein
MCAKVQRLAHTRGAAAATAVRPRDRRAFSPGVPRLPCLPRKRGLAELARRCPCVPMLANPKLLAHMGRLAHMRRTGGRRRLFGRLTGSPLFHVCQDFHVCQEKGVGRAGALRSAHHLLCGRRHLSLQRGQARQARAAVRRRPHRRGAPAAVSPVAGGASRCVCRAPAT